MNSFLTQLLDNYGHYVHGCSNYVRYFNAYRFGRGIVHVHHDDTASLVGSDDDRFRRLGHPQDFPLRQGNPLAQFKIGFIAASLFLGMLFAQKANASVFNNLNLTTTNNQFCQLGYTDSSGNTSCEFTFASSTLQLELTDVSFIGANATYDTNTVQRLTVTTDKGTWVSTTTAGGYSSLETTKFDFPYPHPWATPGSDWEFNLSLDVSTTTLFQYFWAVTSTSDAHFPEVTQKQSIAGDYSLLPKVPQIDLNSSGLGGMKNYQATIVSQLPPESTYTGNFSQLLTSFDFGSPTSSEYAQGQFLGHITEMLGTSTTTFPVCTVWPLFTLLDELQGLTTATNTAQYMVISGGLVTTDTVISLEAVSTTFATTGFRNIYDIFVPFLETVAWMYFGFMVYKAIFIKSQPTE